MKIKRAKKNERRQFWATQGQDAEAGLIFLSEPRYVLQKPIEERCECSNPAMVDHGGSLQRKNGVWMLRLTDEVIMNVLQHTYTITRRWMPGRFSPEMYAMDI